MSTKKRKHKASQRKSQETQESDNHKFYRNLIIAILVVVVSYGFVNYQLDDKNDEGVCDASKSLSSSDRTETVSSSSSSSNDDCALFLAKSTLGESGLGMFTAVDIPNQSAIGYPDIVIHLSDPHPQYLSGLALLLEYVWNGQDLGGQYEGMRVYSLAPGVGMAANGHESSSNSVYFRPHFDNAGLSRHDSPGTGSISYHYNFSFYTKQLVPAGGELLVDYGPNWFHKRKEKLSNTKTNLQRPVSWLRQHGVCLDNIKQGPSTIPDAGRGAFATRFMVKGSVIAPAPLIPLTNQESLDIIRIKQNDVTIHAKQLLFNYCFGHPHSSLLFFPYTPTVNFINHSSNANAELRWSNSTQHRGKDWPQLLSLQQLKQKDHTGLMLDFVATRDIQPGEEILLNYGPLWEEAWKAHVQQWQPESDQYVNSTMMNQHETYIRTEQEQQTNSYPQNLFTSCYYQYSIDQTSVSSFVRWKKTKGLIRYNNLRPCAILKRYKDTSNGETLYTVKIKNRYGLSPEQRIPAGVEHIVTHVPRYAIQFSDKLYTTDQYLASAFRHFIQIPNTIFPTQWMDLK